MNTALRCSSWLLSYLGIHIKVVTISFDITYYHEYSTRCARGCWATLEEVSRSEIFGVGVFHEVKFTSLFSLRLHILCFKLNSLSLSANQQRSTLPGSCPPSTLDAGGLYFCVRDGNRCCPSAIATGFARISFFSGKRPHPSGCGLPAKNLLLALGLDFHRFLEPFITLSCPENCI